MTPAERESLKKLAQSPVTIVDIPNQHAEKFVNHGLAVKQVFKFQITTKGQLELLRQRFRNMATRRVVRVSETDFMNKLDSQFERLRNFRRPVSEDAAEQQS